MSQIYQKERINYIKTMKKIIALIVLATLFVAGNGYAQTQLVATLKHGDKTTLFYGANACQEAHDAAEDGDVITLSEGVFGATTLSKSVTVRGAGVNMNGENRVWNTKITSFNVGNNAKGIIVEGVYFYKFDQWHGNLTEISDVSDVQIIRCQLPDVWIWSTSSFTFVNCIGSAIYIAGADSQVTALNCALHLVETETESSTLHCENCVLGFYWDRTMYSTFTNCIMFGRNNDVQPPAYTTCNNCVGINVYNEREIFAIVTGSSNQQVSSYTDLFKTLVGTSASLPVFSDSETFELTDEAAATYLGDDGKQVGIYGGDHPFTTTLSYPQATSVNVAKKAVDGKLAVDIKFNGAE